MDGRQLEHALVAKGWAGAGMFAVLGAEARFARGERRASQVLSKLASSLLPQPHPRQPRGPL